MSHRINIQVLLNYLGPSGGDMDELPEAFTSANVTLQGPHHALDAEDLLAQSVLNKIDGKDDYVPLVRQRFINSLTEIKEKEKKTIILPAPVQKIYTLQERVEQVQNGTYIRLCITAAPQKISDSSMALQNEKGLILSTLSNNFKNLDDGTMEIINQWLLKKQRQVLGYLLKQFGTALVCGKSIMSISLPIGIFEPRSLLERMADCFVYAPHFLEKAGETTDSLEQFKLATTFYLTNLVTDLNPEKPFNPIIGETFQAVIGGCIFTAEQISHHPPVSIFQMEGKNFKIEGSFWLSANTSANSVKFRKTGDYRLTFKNTGNVYQVQYPLGYMNGISFGKRTWQYTKKFQVYDFKNRYYSEIDFEKSENAKKRKENPGYFTGAIHKVSEKFCVKAQQEYQKQKEAEIKFKEKDHSAGKLGNLEGNWLNSLSIDNKVYWSHANPWPYKLQYFDNPLPSDCNFRLDVLHLKCGDEIKAQEAKVMLEESQRKDKKLREQFKSKHYK